MNFNGFTAGIWSIPCESRTENRRSLNFRIAEISPRTANRIFLHYGFAQQIRKRAPLNVDNRIMGKRFVSADTEERHLVSRFDEDEIFLKDFLPVGRCPL